MHLTTECTWIIRNHRCRFVGICITFSVLIWKTITMDYHQITTSNHVDVLVIGFFSSNVFVIHLHHMFYFAIEFSLLNNEISLNKEATQVKYRHAKPCIKICIHQNWYNRIISTIINSSPSISSFYCYYNYNGLVHKYTHTRLEIAFQFWENCEDQYQINGIDIVLSKFQTI